MNKACASGDGDMTVETYELLGCKLNVETQLGRVTATIETATCQINAAGSDEEEVLQRLQQITDNYDTAYRCAKHAGLDARSLHRLKLINEALTDACMTLTARG